MERHGGTALDRRIRWRRGAIAVGIGRAVMRVLDQLLRWHEVAEQRRRLLEMDDRTMCDLGLSRADVEQEGRRPFWEAGSSP